MRKFFSLIAAVLFAGSMMADNFALVTSVSDLADGDQIIITNVDADRAISTTQNNNNRGVAQVTATNDVIVPDETVQIITLVADGSNFMLQVGEDAYLYAASNSSNHLKTSTAATVGDNGKFAITIAADSIASVIAQGTNGRNDLRYNTSGLFSCYASSTSVEAGLKIFKNQNGGGVVPPTPADTYTVAGSDAAIFGESWNPALAANDMTLTNGIYKWEKAELDLTAGDIEFKVVKNHSWDVAYPASNYVLNIAEDGEYTITITFDPATEAVAAEAVKKEPLADPTNCAEAAAAALSVSGNNVEYKGGQVYTIEGYVTAIQTAYSATNHNITFWMADTENGGNVLEAYRAACASEEDAPAVGDKVAVTGKLTKYNSTPEFAQGCTFVITEKSAPAVNLGEKTIAEFLELKNFKDTCILTGVVTSIANTTYGNLYLADETDTVYVYGVLTPAGESKKFADLGVEAGDTLTVLAIYNEYQGAPQVTNAIFVEVKKAPSQTITIDIESGVEYTDYVAAQGWWQFIAENDEYEISLSNVSTTQAAGVYTVADMDQDYTYIYIKATEETITFVDGEFTLTEGEDGSRTIEGVMTGDDGNIYNIKLVFRIPTAETTVNVEIPEWGIADPSEYYGFAGYIFYGETADKNIYVQLVIPGNNPFGTFTYDDCYVNGTGIEVAGDYKSIYSMNFTVTAGGTAGAERAFVTADILCYNNTLYHVTTTIGEGINNVEDAVKAIKSIVNGQVVIEKAGKTYNMNGAVIR